MAAYNTNINYPFSLDNLLSQLINYVDFDAVRSELYEQDDSNEEVPFQIKRLFYQTKLLPPRLIQSNQQLLADRLVYTNQNGQLIFDLASSLANWASQVPSQTQNFINGIAGVMNNVITNWDDLKTNYQINLSAAEYTQVNRLVTDTEFRSAVRAEFKTYTTDDVLSYFSQEEYDGARALGTELREKYITPLDSESVFDEWWDDEKETKMDLILDQVWKDLKLGEARAQEREEFLSRTLVYYPDGDLNVQASLQAVQLLAPDLLESFIYALERSYEEVVRKWPEIKRSYDNGEISFKKFDRLQQIYDDDPEVRFKIFESFKASIPGLVIKEDPTLSIVEYPKDNLELYRNDIDGLYQTYLGREVDRDGLEYWVGLLSSGIINIGELQQRLYNSQEAREFRQLFQNQTIEDTIAAGYEAVLGRQADTGGLEYWTSTVKLGQLTIDQVLDELKRSPEGQAVQAETIRRELQGQIDFYIAADLETATLDAIAGLWAGARELEQKLKTNDINYDGFSGLGIIQEGIRRIEVRADEIAVAVGKYREIIATVRELTFPEDATENDRQEIRKEATLSLLNARTVTGELAISSREIKLVKRYFPDTYNLVDQLEVDGTEGSVSEATAKRVPWMGVLDPSLEAGIQNAIEQWIIEKGSITESEIDQLQLSVTRIWRENLKNNNKLDTFRLAPDDYTPGNVAAYVIAFPERIVQGDDGVWNIYGLDSTQAGRQADNDGILVEEKNGTPLKYNLRTADGSTLFNIIIRLRPELLPQALDPLTPVDVDLPDQFDYTGEDYPFSPEKILTAAQSQGIDLGQFNNLLGNTGIPNDAQSLDNLGLVLKYNIDGTLNLIGTLDEIKTRASSLLGVFTDLFSSLFTTASNLSDDEKSTLTAAQLSQIADFATNSSTYQSAFTGFRDASQSSQVSSIVTLNPISNIPLDFQDTSKLFNANFRTVQNSNVIDVDREQVSPGGTVKFRYSVNGYDPSNSRPFTYAYRFRSMNGSRQKVVGDNILTPSFGRFTYAGGYANFEIVVSNSAPVGYQFFAEVFVESVDMPVVYSLIIRII
jgi:hypothetical protein